MANACFIAWSGGWRRRPAGCRPRPRGRRGRRASRGAGRLTERTAWPPPRLRNPSWATLVRTSAGPVPSFRGLLADSRSGASSCSAVAWEMAGQGGNCSKSALSSVVACVALVVMLPMRNARLSAKTVSVTDDRILGHLAQRFAVSEENLATEALTWLLGRSAAARAALVGLARTIGVDVPDELRFVGQVGSPDTGRPDVVGLDASSRERLLIEAKFAAALTDQQPSGYLKRLPPDVDGMLLVVAPTVRLATLWVELLRAVPELAAIAPSPSAVPTGGVLSVKAGAHTTLALVSWRSLVSRVLDALRAADESLLARDAEQLLALTETMDSAAFAPLRPGDLDTRTARQIAQLHLIIDSRAPPYRREQPRRRALRQRRHMGASSTAGTYAAGGPKRRSGMVSCPAPGPGMACLRCGCK